MGTIQFLNGSVLIRSGSVAMHTDCCCTPSCLPDSCVSPSVGNCRNCWDADCNGGSCLQWQLLEVAISGVTDADVPTSWLPGTCDDDFDGCQCSLFNSTFIHDFDDGCQTSWWVREASPPFALFDTCGTPQTLACNAWKVRRNVLVSVAVANEQVSYTTGVVSSLDFPNMLNIGSTDSYYICGNYTLQPGHYVVVKIESYASSNLGIPIYYDAKYFIYGFANGALVDVGCASDQYYPTCGPYIGGNATLLASSRYERSSLSATPSYYNDCDDTDFLCKASVATVTIEAPVIDPCEVEPPPPPPP